MTQYIANTKLLNTYIHYKQAYSSSFCNTSIHNFSDLYYSSFCNQHNFKSTFTTSSISASTAYLTHTPCFHCLLEPFHMSSSTPVVQTTSLLSTFLPSYIISTPSSFPQWIPMPYTFIPTSAFYPSSSTSDQNYHYTFFHNASCLSHSSKSFPL
jgi:hypothetical protein